MNAMDRIAETASKFGDILGRPIGESVLSLGPDELLRIDLWRIRQHRRPLQMAKQVPQESDDLHAGDVFAVETIMTG
ncbi:MAG: hypothetical protein HY748_00120 [Elusimicrobia bacterium]|nr:hypothetical protein [Elusimicrobiota bacterium]